MPRKGLRYLAVVIAGLALVPGSAGGSPPQFVGVSARIDSVTATLGVPITLTLSMRYPANARALLPDLAEYLPEALSLIEPFPVEGARRDSDSGAERSYGYALRAYELGEHTIAPITVAFVLASGDTTLRATAPLPLDIVALRAEGDVELRDIRPPLVIAGGIPVWLAGVLAAAAAVGTALLIKTLLDRRGRREPAETPAPPLDYAREFQRIAGMGLLERGAYKLYYTLLSDTLRRFLGEHTDVDAMEHTTAEITDTLAAISEFPAAVNAGIISFLQAADLVKFARATPAESSAREAPREGVRIVQGTQAWLQERTRTREEEDRAAEEAASNPSHDTFKSGAANPTEGRAAHS